MRVLEKIAFLEAEIVRLGQVDAMKGAAIERWHKLATTVETDPVRMLKNAVFALERLNAPPVSYGGVRTEGGKFAWLEYSLREQGYRPERGDAVLEAVFVAGFQAGRDEYGYVRVEDAWDHHVKSAAGSK